MSRHINKIVKVSAWRENVPAEPTSFEVKRLGVGEQLDIEKLRVRFKVERTLTKTPNACDIYISNLAPHTHADLQTKPLKVQIEAGYDDEPRLLFLGDLLFGMTETDDTGTTHTTLLQLGDGDRVYAHARVNRSWDAGATVRTVLENVARNMGLTLPANLTGDKALDAQYVTGLASHGPARDQLTRILNPLGYHWSLENGVLRILREDEISSLRPIPIGKEQGMIGSPKYGSPPRSGKPPHVTVKLLLYPELVPGDRVQVTSQYVNGLFRIEKVRHEGDTHAEGSWLTEIEVKPL